MNEIIEKDVYIKDEGDFATIVFQTDNAKKAILTEEIAVNHLYGKEILKLDIANESIELIKSWLISHNLSWNEF